MSESSLDLGMKVGLTLLECTVCVLWTCLLIFGKRRALLPTSYVQEAGLAEKETESDILDVLDPKRGIDRERAQDIVYRVDQIDGAHDAWSFDALVADDQRRYVVHPVTTTCVEHLCRILTARADLFRWDRHRFVE